MTESGIRAGGPPYLARCPWAGDDPLYHRYHDLEWGEPEHDERRLFELLTLEGAQAGLSWLTVLRKRDGYRQAFADFDAGRVAGFDHRQVERLCGNAAIVRHRGKIESTISNARRIVALWEQGSSLEQLVWELVDNQPRINRPRSLHDLPAETAESRALSKRLKSLGFRFVGPTTCYAFMQAAGLVNDHLLSCPRHPENQG